RAEQAGISWIRGIAVPRLKSRRSPNIHLRSLMDRPTSMLCPTLFLILAKVRADIDPTDSLDDKDTADLFTGISRSIDKLLWFVEAHLQS
ncbi:MAG: hypothetical protein ABJB40_08815, partial [Acidobacteriota bacterium]